MPANNINLFTPILIPIEPQTSLPKKLLLKGGMVLDQWLYLGNRKVRLVPRRNQSGHFHIQQESSSNYLIAKLIPLALLVFATKRFKVNPGVLILPLAGKLIYKLSYAMPLVKIAEFERQERKEQAKQKALDLKQNLELVKSKPNWEEEAIQLIRRSYQNSKTQELVRLKTIGVLNEETEKRIDLALNHIYYVQVRKTEKTKKALKVLLTQAYEIKMIFSKGYHIFTHGQSTNWLIFSVFIKMMLEKRVFSDLDNPQYADLAKNLKHFKYLRNFSDQTSLEPTTDMPQNVQDFLNQFPSFSPQFDHDPKVRNNLISVDAYLDNRAPGESALHYLANNVNMYQYKDQNIIKSLIAKAIKSFKPTLSPQVIEKYAKELIKAMPPKPMPCGNLFVICVPKALSEAIQYRSHPYGIPCNCDTPAEKEAILEDLQMNKIGKTNCIQASQYRLYTPLLRPEFGVRIFRLIPFSRDDKDALKGNVSSIVDRLHKE